MNSSENQPGLQLPAPVPEQAQAAAGESDHATQPSPEQASSAPELASNPAASAPADGALPSIPMPTQGLPTTSKSDVSTTTNNQGSTIADDDDLIEKEWVEKAKKIVEANRDNPYVQSEELTVVKADYMQKRYNKTIKLNK